MNKQIEHMGPLTVIIRKESGASRQEVKDTDKTSLDIQKLIKQRKFK